MAAVLVKASEVVQQLMDGTLTDGTVISGVLDLSAGNTDLNASAKRRLPNDLTVDVLKLDDRVNVQEVLPDRMTVYELSLCASDVETIPAGIKVQQKLDLTSCTFLESLPEGLTVNSLQLQGCTGLRALPERLDVWFLGLSGCWALEHWPASARVRSGQLALPGCVALQSLPESLGRLSALDVRECPQLTSLPSGLEVTGWIDLAHSGLTSEESIPESMGVAQLRWSNVPIDRRIAFHPELITPDEVIAEENAELRRVLIDRYGYGRLLADLNAEVLDADTDPGGARQLLRVALQDDEDLVAMSCHCPSTGRQYVIRVPPTTKSCRHAAAWIAGFDDPDDYQPLMET